LGIDFGDDKTFSAELWQQFGRRDWKIMARRSAVGAQQLAANLARRSETQRSDVFATWKHSAKYDVPNRRQSQLPKLGHTPEMTLWETWLLELG
jgi:hypothetical protein